MNSGITIKVCGVEMTLQEARAVYDELRLLFDKPAATEPSDPWPGKWVRGPNTPPLQPMYPWRPYIGDMIPNPYEITCGGRPS